MSSDGSSSEGEEGEAVSSEVIQQMEEIRKMVIMMWKGCDL